MEVYTRRRRAELLTCSTRGKYFTTRQPGDCYTPDPSKPMRRLRSLTCSTSPENRARSRTNDRLATPIHRNPSDDVPANNRRPALLSRRTLYSGRRSYRLELLIPCELNNRASFKLLSVDIIDLLCSSPLQTSAFRQEKLARGKAEWFARSDSPDPG